MRPNAAARPAKASLSHKSWLHSIIQSSPPRFALLVFTGLILLWTLILALPISSATGTFTPIADALFTAVSAICVTGLSTVNMGEHWSLFGDLVILAGIQMGGIGVLTLASILGLTVTRRLGLRQRLLAASDSNPARAAKGTSEQQPVGLGEMGGLLAAVAVSLLAIEAALTLLITPKLMSFGYDLWHALWHAFYLAASAFTNTGFVALPDGLEPYAGDAYLLIVLALGVFLGSIGFPVIYALYRYVSHRGWKTHRRLGLHAKLTLSTTLLLVLVGWLAIGLLEIENSSTFGGENAWRNVLGAGYMSVMTRSGGLSIVDPVDLNGSTMFVMDILMFIGGGSASTAGGIKVTTIAVLFLAAYAEARGYQDVQSFGRSIPVDVLRIAVSIVIWGATIVSVSTLILLHMTKLPLEIVLFEVISAFGTCGLSTGLSESISDPGKFVLAATMWAGRIGTVTLAAAVAASSRRRMFRLPEERPIVG